MTSYVSPLPLAGPLRYNELVLRPAVAGDGILELQDIIPEGPAGPSIKYVTLMCFLGTSVQASSIGATERTHPHHPNARIQQQTEYRTHVDIP